MKTTSSLQNVVDSLSLYMIVETVTDEHLVSLSYLMYMQAVTIHLLTPNTT